MVTDRRTHYIQAIHAVYPDLTIHTADVIQGGQFNDILRVNRTAIFRFPKTPREAEKLAAETELLRALQGQVPLPVPDPLWQSAEDAPPGEVFMGYPPLPGEPLWPATFTALDGERRRNAARQLAGFLRTLHRLPAASLPRELPAGQGIAAWRDLYRRICARLYPHMRPDARAAATRHFAAYLDDERAPSYTPALIHGDFGPGNILYDPHTGTLSGVIDFSSAGWGDPALDVAALSGPASYGEALLALFAEDYPDVAALLPRVRFYTGTFALQEALYGLEDGDARAFERGIAQYR